MYANVCKYICKYTPAYAFLFAKIFMYVHTCIYVYICTYRYIYIYICVHFLDTYCTLNKYIYIYVHVKSHLNHWYVYTDIYLHTFTYLHIYIYIHTCTYICTQIYIFTHTYNLDLIIPQTVCPHWRVLTSYGTCKSRCLIKVLTEAFYLSMSIQNGSCEMLKCISTVQARTKFGPHVWSAIF